MHRALSDSAEPLTLSRLGPWLAVAVAFGCLVPSAPLAAQLVDGALASRMATAVREADRALSSWLPLLTPSEARGAWDRASQYFRDRITPETWAHIWAGRRLQPIVGRVLTAVRYVPVDAPKFPEAVVFDTRVDFRGDTKGGETIVMGLDADGVWRVREYAVSPNPTYRDGRE